MDEKFPTFDYSVCPLKRQSRSQCNPYSISLALWERKGWGSSKNISLHFVSKLPRNLFSDAVVGDLFERYLSICELACGLERRYDLVIPSWVGTPLPLTVFR